MPRSERIARLLVVPLALLFGFLLVRGSGSASPEPVTTGAGVTTSPTSATTATTAAAPPGSSTTAEVTTTTAAPSTTATTTSTTATTAPGALDLPPADPGGPPAEPVATYRDGGVVLTGSVPDRATATAYVTALTSVFGDDAVTVDVTRDARVSGTTLRVDVGRAFRLPEPGTDADPGLVSLAAVATDVLDAAPDATLVITGHTDAIGTESTNLALSIARARLVVEDLVERGLPRERLVATGAGESEPVATNDTPEGRLQNRRITAAFEGITTG